MDDFLTDQQQAARVKSWLREFAPPAVVALAIGIGGYFGYTQWQERGDLRSAEASELFEELRSALGSDRRDAAADLHQRLVSEFSGSGYASHARLLMAREYVDTTRPSEAVEELSALIGETDDEDLAQLARLRLARVYLYMEQPEMGLQALDGGAPTADWTQLTEDMRGDLYRNLGRFDEARAAYQAALENRGQLDPGWIRMKLDYLSGAAAAASQDGEADAEADAGAETDADAGAEPESQAEGNGGQDSGAGQVEETEPAPDSSEDQTAEEAPEQE